MPASIAPGIATALAAVMAPIRLRGVSRRAGIRGFLWRLDAAASRRPWRAPWPNRSWPSRRRRPSCRNWHRRCPRRGCICCIRCWSGRCPPGMRPSPGSPGSASTRRCSPPSSRRGRVATSSISAIPRRRIRSSGRRETRQRRWPNSRPRRKRPGWRFISISCWTAWRPAARCMPATPTGSRPRPRPARPTRARHRPSAAPPAPAGRSPRWPRRWAAGGRNGCAASPPPASPASAATCRPGCPTAIWRRLTTALPQARFLAWTAGVPAPEPAGPGRGRLRRGLRQPGLVGCRGVLAGGGGGAAVRHRPDHLDGRGALRPAPGRARRRCLDGGARGAAAPAAGGRARRRAAGADGLRIRRPPAARCGARPSRRLGLAAAAGELRPLGRAARRQCGDRGTVAGPGRVAAAVRPRRARSPPCCAPPGRMHGKPRRPP